MANHCYNAISINGKKEELTALYKRFTKEEDYMDFEHVLGMKEIPNDEIHQIVGTTLFTPDIEFLNNTINLSGRSAWYPPVALFVNLVKIFPSLDVNMNFEESGMCFGGEVQINKAGTKEIFSGTYWQYRAYQDYSSFVEAAQDEIHCLIDDGAISNETALKNLDVYESLKEEDKVPVLKDVIKRTTI